MDPLLLSPGAATVDDIMAAGAFSPSNMCFDGLMQPLFGSAHKLNERCKDGAKADHSPNTRALMAGFSKEVELLQAAGGSTSIILAAQISFNNLHAASPRSKHKGMLHAIEDVERKRYARGDAACDRRLDDKWELNKESTLQFMKSQQHANEMASDVTAGLMEITKHVIQSPMCSHQRPMLAGQLGSSLPGAEVQQAAVQQPQCSSHQVVATKQVQDVIGGLPVKNTVGPEKARPLTDCGNAMSSRYPNVTKTKAGNYEVKFTKNKVRYNLHRYASDEIASIVLASYKKCVKDRSDDPNFLDDLAAKWHSILDVGEGSVQYKQRRIEPIISLLNKDSSFVKCVGTEIFNKYFGSVSHNSKLGAPIQRNTYSKKKQRNS